MNRNVESHFSMLPSADIERSRFDRSQDIKFTFNVGELIPFFVDEVLPGDTFDITTSKVVRMQTLLTPVMDNIYLDTYFFFVPNRLVWIHWRELMGENTQSAWLPEAEYSVPVIKLKDAEGVGSETGDGAVKTGDICDYLGIPVGVSAANDATANIPEFNALPLRMYQLIYNDWFRDENLVDPVNIQTGDTNYYYYNDTYVPKSPYKAAKYHDYFTSCLPAPQKGPNVKVPTSFVSQVVGGNASPGWPVIPPSFGTMGGTVNVNTNSVPLTWRTIDGNAITNKYTQSIGIKDYQGNTVVGFTRASDTSGENLLYPDNLFARPASNDNSGLYVDVNDLRYAFQLQKLYERDARGGTRYIEIIRSHFGVDSPDARMQRPEYLGGNRIPISIHQITNQSQGESDFLGDLGAMSLTTDKHSDFTKSFTEHGFVIGICVARYDHSYPQGLNRMWSRKSRFDYYWPVFANLGEQAVLKKEICLSATSSDSAAFGYQERWAEYRYAPNRVAGEMRPGISNTLDSWHFADYYDSVPSLSSSWISEDKTNVDRTLAVNSSVSNQLFADIYVKNYTTRPMPLYSIPGLIDHH